MKKLITTLFLVLLSNYSQGQESYSLTVNVFDLRNSNGNILFLLYNKDGTIPDEKIKNYYKKEVGTTRWVKLNDLNFDIINWSVKDKFIDILN